MAMRERERESESEREGKIILHGFYPLYMILEVEPAKK